MKIGELLAMDEKAPANCWTFGPHGLREGFKIHLDYPGVTGPALIMGEGRWVLRDNAPQRGALYRTSGNYGIMRRAALRYIENHGAGFSVLTMPSSEPGYQLLYVDAALLPGVKPRKPLLAGIKGQAVLRAGSTEGLFRLSAKEPVVVLRADGSVHVLRYNAGKAPAVEVCSNADAMKHRLDHIEELLDDASKLENPSAMIKREDWLCHCLIDLLEAAQYVRRPDERNGLQSAVVDMFVDLRDEGMLRPGVHHRLSDVLSRCADIVRYRFGTVPLSDVEGARVLTPSEEQKRRLRLARRDENRQKRAEENRARQKGPSPAADNGKGRNKKK